MQNSHSSTFIYKLQISLKEGSSMTKINKAWFCYALASVLSLGGALVGCESTPPASQPEVIASVTFKIKVPNSTPSEDEIFMISDFDDFFNLDVIEKYTATREEDGFYYLEVPQPNVDHFYFLFARRSDERLKEVAESGKLRPDRFYQYKGADEQVEITIENWEDFPTDLKLGDTVSPNVHQVADFNMPQLGRTTDLVIYLPPDYQSVSTQKYPVIYMTDGQNLFDEFTSFAGEWRIDEILDKEIAAGTMPPVIIVGIYNGPKRANEYIPWDFGFMGQPEQSVADQFIDFIQETLKPYIDSNYRTLSGATSTGIAGSSFGGLFALYAGITQPDTFGMVGAFSPSVWVNLGDAKYPGIKELVTAGDLSAQLRLYMDGGAEEPPAIDEMRMMKRLLNEQKFPEQQLMIVEDPTGGHNERSWSARFPVALKWLLTADS
ncbi:alpha/beta hydrolase [Corallincola spongiicola]|uniref:Alpha/beta hydrolase n=2 Tax=Corallincola spongiicola TaxID=2520508 RepID=A0ABY1WLF8_9GAMM|nr:alpha/beta hydrolase [Corallincola spongiicola]